MTSDSGLSERGHGQCDKQPEPDIHLGSPGQTHSEWASTSANPLCAAVDFGRVAVGQADTFARLCLGKCVCLRVCTRPLAASVQGRLRKLPRKDGLLLVLMYLRPRRPVIMHEDTRREKQLYNDVKCVTAWAFSKCNKNVELHD